MRGFVSGLIFITIAFAIRYRAYKKPLQGREDTSKIRDAIGGIILYMGLVTISSSYMLRMGPPYKPYYLGLLIGFLMMLVGAYLIKIVSKLKDFSKKEEPGELLMRERRKVKDWIEREKQESRNRIAKEIKERNKKKKARKFEIERVKSGNCPYVNWLGNIIFQNALNVVRK